MTGPEVENPEGPDEGDDHKPTLWEIYERLAADHGGELNANQLAEEADADERHPLHAYLGQDKDRARILFWAEQIRGHLRRLHITIKVDTPTGSEEIRMRRHQITAPRQDGSRFYTGFKDLTDEDRDFTRREIRIAIQGLRRRHMTLSLDSFRIFAQEAIDTLDEDEDRP